MRIGSAGKTFSLTGWKIGYVSGCPTLIALVAKAHQNLTFASAPNLQRAVALGLGKSDEYFAALADELQERRDLLEAGLRRLGFKTLAADGSYFITADISGLGFAGDDVAFCRTITTRPGWRQFPCPPSMSAPRRPSYVRFAFCKRPELLHEAVTRLERWLASQTLTTTA